MTQDRELLANFFRDTCEILTEANPPEGGTTSGDGIYIQGDIVILTAEANENYVLVSWTENDSVVSTNPEYVFFADHSGLIKANFEINTSLSQFNENDFEIFPNPARNYIRIITDKKTSEFINRIEIVDLHGKVLLSEPVNNKTLMQINIHEMHSGIYIIRLMSKGSIWIARKIIIIE